MNRDQISVSSGGTLLVEELLGVIRLKRFTSGVLTDIVIDTNSETPSLHVDGDFVYVTYRRDPSIPEHSCVIMVGKYLISDLSQIWLRSFPIDSTFDALHPKVYTAGIGFLYVCFTDHEGSLILARFNTDNGAFTRRELIRRSVAEVFNNPLPSELSVHANPLNVYFIFPANPGRTEIRIVQYTRNLNVYISDRVTGFGSSQPKSNVRLLEDASAIYLSANVGTESRILALTPSPPISPPDTPLWLSSDLSIHGSAVHSMTFFESIILVIIISGSNIGVLQVSRQTGSVYGPFSNPLVGFDPLSVDGEPHVFSVFPFEDVQVGFRNLSGSHVIEEFSKPSTDIPQHPVGKITRHQVSVLEDFSREFSVLRDPVQGVRLVHTTDNNIVEEVALSPTGNSPSISLAVTRSVTRTPATTPNEEIVTNTLYVCHYQYFESFNKYIVLHTRRFDLIDSVLVSVWERNVVLPEHDCASLFPKISSVGRFANIVYRSSVDGVLRGVSYNLRGELLRNTGIDTFPVGDFDIFNDTQNLYVAGIVSPSDTHVRVLKVKFVDFGKLVEQQTDMGTPVVKERIRIVVEPKGDMFLQALNPSNEIVVENLTYSETKVQGEVIREYTRNWADEFGAYPFFGDCTAYVFQSTLLLIGRNAVGEVFCSIKIDGQKNYIFENSVLFAGEIPPTASMTGDFAVVSRDPWEKVCLVAYITPPFSPGYVDPLADVLVLSGPSVYDAVFRIGSEKEVGVVATINIRDHGRSEGEEVYFYFPYETNGDFEIFDGSSTMTINSLLLHNLTSGSLVVITFTTPGFVDGTYIVTSTPSTTSFNIDYTPGSVTAIGSLIFRDKINPDSGFYPVEVVTQDILRTTLPELNGLRGFVSMSRKITGALSGVPFSSNPVIPLDVEIPNHQLSTNYTVYLDFGLPSGEGNGFYTANILDGGRFRVSYRNVVPLTTSAVTIASGNYTLDPDLSSIRLNLRGHELSSNEIVYLRFKNPLVNALNTDIYPVGVLTEDILLIEPNDYPNLSATFSTESGNDSFYLERVQPITLSRFGHFLNPTGSNILTVVLAEAHQFANGEEVYITFSDPEQVLNVSSGKFTVLNRTSLTFQIDCGFPVIGDPSTFDPRISDRNNVFVHSFLKFPHASTGISGVFTSGSPSTELAIPVTLSSPFAGGSTIFLKFTSTFPDGKYTINRTEVEGSVKTLIISLDGVNQSVGTVDIFSGEYTASSNAIDIFVENHLRFVGDRVFLEFGDPLLEDGLYTVDDVFDEDTIRVRTTTEVSLTSGFIILSVLESIGNGSFVQGVPELLSSEMTITTTAPHGLVKRAGNVRGDMIRVIFGEEGFTSGIFEVLDDLNSPTDVVINYLDQEIRATGTARIERVIFDSYDDDNNYTEFSTNHHLYDQQFQTSVVAYVNKYGALAVRKVDNEGNTSPGETLKLEELNAEYEKNPDDFILGDITIFSTQILITTELPHGLNIDDSAFLKFDGIAVEYRYFRSYRIRDVINNFQFKVDNEENIPDGTGEVLLRKLRLLSNTLPNQSSFGRRPVLTRAGGEFVVSYAVIRRGITSVTILKSIKYDINTFEQLWEAGREIFLPDADPRNLYFRSFVVGGDIFHLYSRSNGELYIYNFSIEDGTINPPRYLKVTLDVALCDLGRIQFVKIEDTNEIFLCYPCGDKIEVVVVEIFTLAIRYTQSYTFTAGRPKTSLAVIQNALNAVIVFCEEEGGVFYHRAAAIDILKGVLRWEQDLPFTGLRNNETYSLFNIGQKTIIFGLQTDGVLASLFINSETGVLGSLGKTTYLGNTLESPDILNYTVISSNPNAESVSIGYTSASSTTGFAVKNNTELFVETFLSPAPVIDVETTEVSQYQTAVQAVRSVGEATFVRDEFILRVRKEDPVIKRGKKLSFKSPAEDIDDGIYEIGNTTSYGFNVDYGEPNLPIKLFLTTYTASTVGSQKLVSITFLTSHGLSIGDKIYILFPRFYSMESAIYEVHSTPTPNQIVIIYPHEILSSLGENITVYTYSNIPYENTASVSTDGTRTLTFTCNAKHGLEEGQELFIDFPDAITPLIDNFYTVDEVSSEYSFTVIYPTDAEAAFVRGVRLITSRPCNLEEFDNVFSVGYMSEKDGIVIVRYTDQGETNQRSLDPLGQSASVHYDPTEDTALYCAYTKNTNTFARYIAVSVRKFDSVTLADEWKFDYVFDDSSSLSFRPRLKSSPYELCLEVVRENASVEVIALDKETSAILSLTLVDPVVQVPLKYTDVGLEVGARGDVYVYAPVSDALALAKYNMSDKLTGVFSTDDVKVTITIANHSFVTGQSLFFDFSPQSNIDASVFTVNAVPDENTFEIILPQSSGIKFTDLPVDVYYKTRTFTSAFTNVNGSSIITVTTPIPHGIENGNRVSVVFPPNLRLLNGLFMASVLSPTSFSIDYELPLTGISGTRLSVRRVVLPRLEWADAFDATGEKMMPVLRESETREIYVAYTEGAGKKIIEITETGTLGWVRDVAVPSYENKVHALYILGGFPVLFLLKVTGQNSASIVARKYDNDGVLISDIETPLQIFDQSVIYTSPSINSRVYIDESLDLANVFDQIWLVLPKPLNNPLVQNLPSYSNWEIYVNKIFVTEYGCPNEFLTEIGPSQVALGSNDQVYLTYQTNAEGGENPIAKTYISRIDSQGITRSLKTFEEGGQAPVVHHDPVRGTYFCFPRRSCTFTDFMTLLTYRVEDKSLTKVWRRRRIFTDGLAEYYKPRITTSQRGVHVAYAKQNGFVHIDTYRQDNGGVIFRSFRTPLETIPTDRIALHATSLFVYVGLPEAPSSVRVTRFTLDTMSLNASVSIGASEPGAKGGVVILTSQDDKYDAGENPYVGYTTPGRIIVTKLDQEDITPIWTSSESAAGFHGLRIFGEYPVAFSIETGGANIQIDSYKWKDDGVFLEKIQVPTTIPSSVVSPTINKGTVMDPLITPVQPLFTSKSPWERGVLYFYTNASVPLGELVSPYDRLVVAGFSAPLSYQISVPTSEISEFQYEISSTNHTYVVYNLDLPGQTGVYLGKVDSLGMLVVAPVLVDENGQSPTVTINGGNVYVGYIRFQTGFASATIHIVKKYTTDLVLDVLDPQSTTDLPDTTPVKFRPRMRTGMGALFSAFIRETEDIYIEKISLGGVQVAFEGNANSRLLTIDFNTVRHESAVGRQVYADLPSAFGLTDGFYYVVEILSTTKLVVDYEFPLRQDIQSFARVYVPSRLFNTRTKIPLADPLTLKLETGFTSVFLSYPIDDTNNNIEVRKYSGVFDLIWDTNLVTSIKTNIKFREDPTGAVLAYFDNGDSFKVTKLNQNTGVEEWVRDIDLTNVVGNSVSNLYVILGYILVFTFHTNGNFIISKLDEEGVIVSKRETFVPTIDVLDIIDYPVIIAQDPWEVISYIYYTSNVGIGVIQTAPDRYIHLGSYAAPLIRPSPIPRAETGDYQSLILPSGDRFHVYSDETLGLQVFRNGTSIYSVNPLFKPRTPSITFKGGFIYLVYISYVIAFTEIVNMITVKINANDPTILSSTLRSFPDPEPDNFAPISRPSDNFVHRAYVRFNGKLYLDTFIDDENRPSYPTNTGLPGDPFSIALQCIGDRVFAAIPDGGDITLIRYTEDYNEDEDSYLFTPDSVTTFDGGNALVKTGITLRADGDRLYMTHTGDLSEGVIHRINSETLGIVWTTEFSGIAGFLGSRHTHGFSIFESFPLVFTLKEGAVVASKFNDVTGVEVSTLTRELVFPPTQDTPHVLSNYPWETIFISFKTTTTFQIIQRESLRQYILPPRPDKIVRRHQASAELFEGKTTAVRYTQDDGVFGYFSYYRTDPFSQEFPPEQILDTEFNLQISEYGTYPSIARFENDVRVFVAYMETFHSFTEVQLLNIKCINAETLLPDLPGTWGVFEIFPDATADFHPLVRGQESTVTVAYVRGDRLLNLNTRDSFTGASLQVLVTSHTIPTPYDMEVAGDDDFFIAHAEGDVIKVVRFIYTAEGVIVPSWDAEYTDGNSFEKLHISIIQSVPQHVFVSYTAFDTTLSAFICKLFRVERRSSEVLWSRRTIDNLGGPVRLNGLDFEGSFINSTVVDLDFDGNPATIDILTFNLSYDNIKSRTFGPESFDASLPLFDGTPLIIYNQGDAWAMLIYEDTAGGFQIIKLPIIGGAKRIIYDERGKVINPVKQIFDSEGNLVSTVDYEDWWRPFLTINPERRGIEKVVRTPILRPGRYNYFDIVIQEAEEGRKEVRRFVLEITTDDPHPYEVGDVITLFNIQADVPPQDQSGFVQAGNYRVLGVVSDTVFRLDFTSSTVQPGTTGDCTTVLNPESGEDGLVEEWHYNGHVKSIKNFVGKFPSGDEIEFSKNGQWVREYTKFVGAGKNLEWGLPTRTNVQALFNLFDSNADGFLELADLRQMVEEYGGYSLEDDAYEEVFNSMSPDEDGRVEFQNFRKIVGASIFTKDILNRGINHVVKSLEVDLFDGLKSGTEIEYYLQRPAPALKSEVNYIINPETGLPVRNGMFTEYYDDGISKRVEVNYVLNLKEGFEILYWPPSVGSNRIRSEVEFLNGRETDVRREFFEDGSFKTVYEPFSSLLDYDIAFRYTAYFKPPTLNTDPDQFIRERYTLERNRFKQGPEILFYSPGVKRHEGSFIRGQKIGLWTYYLPDGVTIDFTETWIIDTTSRVLKTIRV